MSPLFQIYYIFLISLYDISLYPYIPYISGTFHTTSQRSSEGSLSCPQLKPTSVTTFYGLLSFLFLSHVPSPCTPRPHGDLPIKFDLNSSQGVLQKQPSLKQFEIGDHLVRLLLLRNQFPIKILKFKKYEMHEKQFYLLY